MLELALLCGRYLELVETNQPSLCKGRGTTNWWKDCFGRHFRLYKIYSIYDVDTLIDRYLDEAVREIDGVWDGRKHIDGFYAIGD